MNSFSKKSTSALFAVTLAVLLTACAKPGVDAGLQTKATQLPASDIPEIVITADREPLPEVVIVATRDRSAGIG